MCGRARISSDVSEIRIVFSIPPERPTPNFAPSWNVAPTDPLPVVRYDAKERQRSLDIMRWGLMLYWAKDIKIGYSTFNARAEEIDTKPAFREAFRRRRCLVPLTIFTNGRRRQPASSPMQSGSPVVASLRWRACGRLGAHPKASVSAAARSSRRGRTNYARISIIACRWS
jgi:putative SOS response-associated peptidase YedK